MKKPVGFAIWVIALVTVLAVAGCGLFNPSTTTTSSTTTISTTTTTTEAPASWAEVHPAGAAPSSRCYQAMVYEPTSKRVIMFAGFDGTDALNQTWAYDATGKTWANLDATGKDQPKAAVQMPAVYEPSTNKVITFDGTTWGYDVVTNAWKALSPKSKLKPARMSSCMALDEGSGKIILFGGTDMNKWYDETWSYDPTANSWTNLKPAGDVPPGRSDAGMAYDPTSGKIFLFGGVDADFNCLNDTWSYDPAADTWTKLPSTSADPTARSGLGLAYDPHSKMIIMFGGIDSQFTCYDDTWALDPGAGTWTQLQPVGTSPSARGRSVLVYDVDIDMMVLFGGETVQGASDGNFGTQVYLKDTWIYGVDPEAIAGETTDTQVTPATSTTLSTGASGPTSTTAP